MRRVERDLRRFRQEGGEDFYGLLAVLDDCFRRLQLVRQQQPDIENGISLAFLRYECQKAEIGLIDSFFERTEFTDIYFAQRDGNIIQMIYKK